MKAEDQSELKGLFTCWTRDKCYMGNKYSFYIMFSKCFSFDSTNVT